jgi:hypothetical protein
MSLRQTAVIQLSLFKNTDISTAISKAPVFLLGRGGGVKFHFGFQKPNTQQ